MQTFPYGLHCSVSTYWHTVQYCNTCIYKCCISSLQQSFCHDSELHSLVPERAAAARQPGPGCSPAGLQAAVPHIHPGPLVSQQHQDGYQPLEVSAWGTQRLGLQLEETELQVNITEPRWKKCSRLCLDSNDKKTRHCYAEYAGLNSSLRLFAISLFLSLSSLYYFNKRGGKNAGWNTFIQPYK